MSTEETTQTTAKVEAQPAKPEGQPAKVEAQPAKPEVSDKSAARVLTDADDDIPAEGEMFSLSRVALKARLERYSRKQLRDRFGTDDPDAIQAKLGRAEELERQEEDRKRAAMTEQERLKADLAASEQRAQAAEARARDVEERHVFQAEEQHMTSMASKYIDPDYVDAELTGFAKHLRKSYTAEQLAKLTDSDFEKYWQERVAAKPKLARDYEEKFRAQPPPPAKGLNNGVDPSAKPAPAKSGGDGGAKRFSPGAPGALSSGQARKEAAKEGFRW